MPPDWGKKVTAIFHPGILKKRNEGREPNPTLIQLRGRSTFCTWAFRPRSSHQPPSLAGVLIYSQNREAIEKETATHSSTLAWRIPWTEEPGGLLSMASHRVGHDLSDLACMHALEKEMATHSSVLAWRIPRTEEPVGCRL